MTVRRMPSPFEIAWERLLGVEHGYSNHAGDPGGPTMYGVTERLARSYGYVGDMRYLPVSKARHIACQEFWERLRLDHVATRSEALAGELLDTGYNMGTAQAGAFLQRALNAFDEDGQALLLVDGAIGTKTLDALYAFLLKRGTLGEACLLRCLNAQQCLEYISIVERRPESRAFFFGWISKRVT